MRKNLRKRSRVREIFNSAAVSLCMTLATLAVLEVVLRVADFRELRETLSEGSLGYGYDPEIGWAPVPNSSSVFTGARTFHIKHNSLGLRDEEFSLNSRPTIMFLGDSFVWGFDSEVGERFSDLLKPKIPDYNILAAGVAGYGTDQEYLLLKRLWPKIKPAVVMLIFCSQNDRMDNSSNVRYQSYQKPYFMTRPDGSLVLMGQPVPESQLLRYSGIVRHLWLARLVTNIYVRLRSQKLELPDPTEKLVGKMREFVEANGAKFLVGIQYHDEALARYLEANRIPLYRSKAPPSIPSPDLVPIGRPRGKNSSRTAFWACCPQTTSFTTTPPWGITRHEITDIDRGFRFILRPARWLLRFRRRHRRLSLPDR